MFLEERERDHRSVETGAVLLKELPGVLTLPLQLLSSKHLGSFLAAVVWQEQVSSHSDQSRKAKPHQADWARHILKVLLDPCSYP